MRLKNALLRFLFFIGWLLSPLTFWNDAFFNIPLSYLLANVLIRVWPVDFIYAVLVFYWLSNGLGVLMMYLAGADLIKEGRGGWRQALYLLITIIAYSAVLVILNLFGVIKPIFFNA